MSAMPEMTHGQSKPLTIRRVNPNNIQPEFVNDLAIGTAGVMFYLTFSRIQPPVVTADEVQKLETVDAIASTVFVVTPDFFEAMANAMKTGLDNYKTTTVNKKDEAS